MLPINVMACKKMLVLCGPSYPSRLWCAWELCTHFSFMRQEQALARVVLLPLNQDPDCDVSYSLLKFDVNEARCYDPNEEAKIRSCIQANGAEGFNMCVRQLGQDLEAAAAAHAASVGSSSSGPRSASPRGSRSHWEMSEV